MLIEFKSGIHKGRNELEDLFVDWMIILRWMVQGRVLVSTIQWLGLENTKMNFCLHTKKAISRTDEIIESAFHRKHSVHVLICNAGLNYSSFCFPLKLTANQQALTYTIIVKSKQIHMDHNTRSLTIYRKTHARRNISIPDIFTPRPDKTPILFS